MTRRPVGRALDGEQGVRAQASNPGCSINRHLSAPPPPGPPASQITQRDGRPDRTSDAQHAGAQHGRG